MTSSRTTLPLCVCVIATMKLSVTALTGAIVGTAALVSFAAVPAEATSSWSLSSLWNSASKTNGPNAKQGSSMTPGGPTRLKGRRAEMDMDHMDGDEIDYSGLSAEEIAVLNGEVDDNSETMMMNGGDGDMMGGGMSDGMDDGMDGMDDSSAASANANKFVYYDEQPVYNGPQDDEDQAEGLVGLETYDDQGEDPVAAEEAEKQAAMEAMDEQEAAELEFQSDGEADCEY